MDANATKIEVLADLETAAQRAADIIVEMCRAAVMDRGVFTLAVSGSNTPIPMFRALAIRDMPWDKIHIFQVDERVAPAGDSDRNLLHLSESLVCHVPLPPDHLHPMPVESNDLQAAAARYARVLSQVVGNPPAIDLVHLGLGKDGHTGSLVPDDPVLDVEDCDVAVTGVYEGRKRLTFTYPAINRACCLLWLVSGGDKAAPLSKMVKRDPSIPAGRVRARRSIVVADEAAAALI